LSLINKAWPPLSKLAARSLPLHESRGARLNPQPSQPSYAHH